MSRKPLKQVHRIKPANLDRQDVLRAIREAVNLVGWREFERRSGLPRTTFSRWIHQNRIPPRSLERAQGGLGAYRKYKKPVPPPEPLNVTQQIEQVHWAFSLGPVTASFKEPHITLDKVAREITTTGETQTDLKHFTQVRDRVSAIAAKGNYQNYVADGQDYQKLYHEQETEQGRQALSDAFVEGLRWLFETIQLDLVITDIQEETLGMRPNSSVTTYEAFKIWDIFDYCKGLPSGYFLIYYYPFDRYPGTYELMVYEQEKDSANAT